MKIALLTKNFNKNEKDAAVTTVINLAISLKKQGHTAIVISERGFKKYLGYKKNKSYELISDIEIFRPYGLLWFRTEKWFLDPTILINIIFARAIGVRYVEKIKKIKFDVIHSFGAAPVTVLGTILAKVLCPHTKTIHSIKAISAHSNYFFSPGHPNFNRLYCLINHITISLPLLKKKLNKCGIDTKKISLINSFIDLKVFHPKDKAKLRKEYNYGKEKIVLYFGPLGKYKGTDYLLRAISIIKSKVPNLKIILAHPAYFTKSQKKYIEQFNINKCIELKERRDKKSEIENYINIADVVVLPYTTLEATEANPLCLLESIACKTPVVTTDLPELREIVRPNVDVMMARLKSSESLADNIIKVLQNKSLQKKLANNAFKKISAFDINNSVEKLIKIYKELISK